MLTKKRKSTLLTLSILMGLTSNPNTRCSGNSYENSTRSESCA